MGVLFISRFLLFPGCQLGVTSHSLDGTVHKTGIGSAKYLARRVVKIAQKLNTGT